MRRFELVVRLCMTNRLLEGTDMHEDSASSVARWEDSVYRT